jgi:NDP-sugar pyrophosphorylase family protein
LFRLAKQIETLEAFELTTAPEFRARISICQEFISNWDLNFQELTEGFASTHISDEAEVHPTAILGPGVILLPGASVGPYCYLKSQVIVGRNVVLGFNVEADRLILGRGAKVAHAACVGRSIIGAQCNLGYNFVNATAHIYQKPIKAWVAPNKSIESKAKHHGAVLGGFTRVAVNVSTMPGSAVEPHAVVSSGTIIKGYFSCGE